MHVPAPANSPLSPAAARALDVWLTETAAGMNTYVLRCGREAEYARLHALPDAALSAMGVQRGDLAAWLFRDHFPR